jgi:hypothetical protein
MVFGKIMAPERPLCQTMNNLKDLKDTNLMEGG